MPSGVIATEVGPPGTVKVADTLLGGRLILLTVPLPRLATRAKPPVGGMAIPEGAAPLPIGITVVVVQLSVRNTCTELAAWFVTMARGVAKERRGSNTTARETTNGISFRKRHSWEKLLLLFGGGAEGRDQPGLKKPDKLKPCCESEDSIQRPSGLAKHAPREVRYTNAAAGLVPYRGARCRFGACFPSLDAAFCHNRRRHVCLSGDESGGSVVRVAGLHRCIAARSGNGIADA